MFSVMANPSPVDAPRIAPYRRLGIVFQTNSATSSMLRPLKISSRRGKTVAIATRLTPIEFEDER
jgi:hypothetical protein